MKKPAESGAREDTCYFDRLRIQWDFETELMDRWGWWAWKEWLKLRFDLWFRKDPVFRGCRCKRCTDAGWGPGGRETLRWLSLGL